MPRIVDCSVSRRPRSDYLRRYCEIEAGAARMIAIGRAVRKPSFLLVLRGRLASRLEGCGPGSAARAPPLWPWLETRELRSRLTMRARDALLARRYFSTSLASASATSFFWPASSRKPAAHRVLGARPVDGCHIAGMVDGSAPPAARARIFARHALGLGAGEWDHAARIVADLALVESGRGDVPAQIGAERRVTQHHRHAAHFVAVRVDLRHLQGDDSA